MEKIVLLNLEYTVDEEMGQLKGGLSERVEELLTKEQIEKVEEVFDMVVEVFTKDMEIDIVKKVKIEKDDDKKVKDYFEKIKALGDIARAFEIDKTDFMFSCLKDLPTISKVLGVTEKEAFIFLSESVDKIFE